MKFDFATGSVGAGGAVKRGVRSESGLVDVNISASPSDRRGCLPFAPIYRLSARPSNSMPSCRGRRCHGGGLCAPTGPPPLERSSCRPNCSFQVHLVDLLIIGPR
eukprot:8813756-Pyramimonas_sp.AAC.1